MYYILIKIFGSDYFFRLLSSFGVKGQVRNSSVSSVSQFTQPIGWFLIFLMFDKFKGLLMFIPKFYSIILPLSTYLIEYCFFKIILINE